MNWDNISHQISTDIGQAFNITSVNVLAGGDINSAFHVVAQNKSYFIKLNRPNLVDMFEAEFVGLEALINTRTLRVPQPLVFGSTDTEAFLLMEYIEWGRSNVASDRLLGQQLAQLHLKPQAYFGWMRDNTIGNTVQINQPYSDWPSFWREQRLGVQLRLAAGKGYQGRLQSLGEQLIEAVPAFFMAYQPVQSLLHGDLWGGNVGVDKQGAPVIFDPACYYGDRETDLAMTELFGGFSPDFYAAYREVWPLDTGYKLRKNLYNLYHILNHLNMFGGGYLSQAEGFMMQLLAEVA